MNKIKLNENQTREEWLALRRRGIGGSDASVVCGVNKYKSVIELWMDKTGQILDDEDSDAAYWGRTIEPIIREEFSKRSGLTVRTVPYMMQHEEYKFMLANVDGEVDDPQYGTCVFEAKTATIFKSAEWEVEIPEEYYLQVQHYMAVTGYNGAYIAALIGGNRFIWKFIPRDEKVIELLIKLEERFRQYVRDKEIPPLDGSEASKQLLSKLYPEAEDTKTIELPEEALLQIHIYEEASEEEKKITERKEEAANKLKAMLMDAEVGAIRDREVIWKNIRSERFDSKELKLNEPELYKDYTYTTTYRKFSIK
jgi:putative phage-type endonuclease